MRPLPQRPPETSPEIQSPTLEQIVAAAIIELIQAESESSPPGQQKPRKLTYREFQNIYNDT